MIRLPFKDPDEKLRYEIDWAPRLGADDDIASVVWTMPDGLTLVSESLDGTVSILTIEGGEADEYYNISGRCTATSGQIYDERCRVRVGVR